MAHRIDTPNAVAELYVEAAGLQPRTLTSAEWLTYIQEERATLIEAEGLTLDQFDWTQFRVAFLIRLAQELIDSGTTNASNTFIAQENTTANLATYLVGGPESNGVFVIATESVLTGQPFVGTLKRDIELVKDIAPGITQFVVGQIVYWSLTQNECVSVPNVNHRIIGYSREVAGFLDNRVEVRLNGTSEAP